FVNENTSVEFNVLNRNIIDYINNKKDISTFDSFSIDSLDLSKTEIRLFKHDIIGLLDTLNFSFIDDTVVKITIAFDTKFEFNYYRISDKWCLGFINVTDIFE
ncbi:hypothetical protein ACFL6D_05530, partial [Spirochaetota bacterium]